MLDDLNCLLNSEPQIEKTKIDFSTLLLAICWHDVWKSGRFPTNSAALIFDRMREGIGLMWMFAKKAKEKGLNRSLIRSAGYVIRKHSGFQVFSIGAKEAKTLKDLDMLEEWSLVKLESLKKRYLVPGKINLRLLRLARFYFNNFMAKTTSRTFYFSWSGAEFLRRKELYLKEVKRLYQEYGEFL